MELIQTRIVSDDVGAIAAFYAQLIGVPVTLNADQPAGGRVGHAAYHPALGETVDAVP